MNSQTWNDLKFFNLIFVWRCALTHSPWMYWLCSHLLKSLAYCPLHKGLYNMNPSCIHIHCPTNVPLLHVHITPPVKTQSDLIVISWKWFLLAYLDLTVKFKQFHLSLHRVPLVCVKVCLVSYCTLRYVLCTLVHLYFLYKTSCICIPVICNM